MGNAASKCNAVATKCGRNWIHGSIPVCLCKINVLPQARSRRTSEKLRGSRTCKPNSVCKVGSSIAGRNLRPSDHVPAGRPFLWAMHYCMAQATYPEVLTRRAGTYPAEACAPTRFPPYLVLLRVGFAMPAPLLQRRCALAAPFHPYPCGRYIFCGAFRPPAFTPAARTLSGTLLCGVRTFLSPHLTRDERPSGPAAYMHIICDAPDTFAIINLSLSP